MKTIDLSKSEDWYIGKDQANVYLSLVNTDGDYGISRAEDILLANNLKKICQEIPFPVTFIDLGPGNGTKTLLCCDALNKTGKLHSYVAVDVQPEFLRIGEVVRGKYGIPVETRESSFEEFLSQQIDNPKFIYLGATYCNFNKDEIETQLAQFMNGGDVVYLSAALRPQDVDSLVDEYKASLGMFEPLVRKHNLRGGKLKVRFNFEMGRIEQGYELGDTFFVLGISKKYEEEEFRNQVSRHFNGEFFLEKGHIAFVGRKNGNS